MVCVSNQSQPPYVATLFIAFVSIVICGLFANKIDALSSLVNFGALVAFLCLHISVIGYFMIKKSSKKYIKHLLLPLIGFFIIAYVLFSMDISAQKLGILWLGLGLIYMIVLLYGFKKKLHI